MTSRKENKLILKPIHTVHSVYVQPIHAYLYWVSPPQFNLLYRKIIKQRKIGMTFCESTFNCERFPHQNY